MTIYFSHVGEYSCFSNSSLYGFELDGYWWKTSEHFFQAQKCVGTPFYHQIRLAFDARQAFHLGRSCPLRTDWKEVRIMEMKRGILKKFETNQDIRGLLLSTKNELIVENYPKDSFWGCGLHGQGENQLGKILVEVRDLIRQGGSNYGKDNCDNRA